MILADTSVWIDHLRRGNAALRVMLESETVVCHPFVIGELACGTLRNRDELLHLLHELPGIAVATDAEVLSFVSARRLMGRGLGWVDAHLLASVMLDKVKLWTFDKRLISAANDLRVIAP